jgi:hypothetical protein
MQSKNTIAGTGRKSEGQDGMDKTRQSPKHHLSAEPQSTAAMLGIAFTDRLRMFTKKLHGTPLFKNGSAYNSLLPNFCKSRKQETILHILSHEKFATTEFTKMKTVPDQKHKLANIPN